ncbi:DNA alkylation repair protein [Pseudooctadecabacter jejudonensis]|uniref:DNA alkylation repair enzyme n=1 Tax=Pseudooctadecabacter jejudonensis TaxID=1391910 RepID=A0A1Y5T8K2_9RHOB|nr:DNA alkylation repair protein [Pseudooctadecabacter jejudonensis]SLN58145.1 DNA alkylation repair enzyme [Pseudooctadecabacter jejudonensis]
MTPDAALDELAALGDTYKAGEMAAYHKVDCLFFGISNPDVYECVARWREDASVEDRVALAQGLWNSNVHEARIAAAKLLVQARMRPDDAAWALIASWVPTFEGWAVADHACSAGSRRLIADPARLDEVETWTTSDHLWTKRAALVMTLPWTKQKHPKPDEVDARERILGWAAGYVTDPQWFIQKAVSWWLRDLGRRDPDRVWAFLDAHGDSMKPFARKDASRKLPPRS